MPLHDVYLVSPHLQLVTEAEIDALEAKLGFKLPLGYREYLRTLGNGYFCHDLHVWPPAEVMDPQNTSFWSDLVQDTIEERYYAERCLLSDSELRDTVVFAKSDEGDHYVSCPQRPGQVFELPRHDSMMHYYPEGFLEPFKFEFCRISEFKLPFFVPPNSRQAQGGFTVNCAAEVADVWDYVARIGPSPLRVAEGEIGVTDRVIAFIPDIYGCAWQENLGFDFFAIAEHADKIAEIERKFRK